MLGRNSISVVKNHLFWFIHPSDIYEGNVSKSAVSWQQKTWVQKPRNCKLGSASFTPGSLKMLKKHRKTCDRKLIYTKPSKPLLFVMCSFPLLRNDPWENFIALRSRYPVDFSRCLCPGVDFFAARVKTVDSWLVFASQEPSQLLSLRRESRSWSCFWYRGVAVYLCRQARSQGRNGKRGEKWNHKLL